MTGGPPDDRPATFTEMVDAYQGRIYGFVSRMCRDTEDARDVLQDTLLAAYRALPGFRGESRFSTWIFRIAANACRRMRRRRKHAPERVLSLDEVLPSTEHLTLEVPDASDGPEARALRAELHAALEEGIARLPVAYRAVLVLRDVEGLPAEEVAAVLGLTVPNVKSRLHRARMFLRHHLAEHAVNPSPGPGL